MAPRALVFQHMDDEPPGLFGAHLAADGFSLDVVMLHRGEVIPALEQYDFLLVMGGAMDVWETEAHPWLVAEKAAIARWVNELKRPYLGICLGHQLLAEAAGGEVGLAQAAEVGWCEVHLTAAGHRHPLLAGFPERQTVMQWHHAEVSALPPGAVVLAASPVTPVQAMAVNGNALGLQFHAELTPELVQRWAHLPQYIAWLEDALGAGAYERVAAEGSRWLPEMVGHSLTIHAQLMAASGLLRAAA